jgi:hypothetical protein
VRKIRKVKRVKKKPQISISQLSLELLVDFCDKNKRKCKECPLKGCMAKNWDNIDCVKPYCYHLLGFDVSHVREMKFVHTYKINEDEVL